MSGDSEDTGSDARVGGFDRNILFIFQPAEEGTRGAKTMLEYGLMEKVPQKPSRLFGIHNRPEAMCGDVIVHRGALMSEKSIFDITFKGRTAHGSEPHKSIDPIVAAAAFVNAVQTVISKNTDPFADAICTVNSIAAGSPDNPSPETARITGYIRSFDDAVHQRMEERVRTLAEGISGAYECGCDTIIKAMVPAVFNSDEMYEYALKAAEHAAGKEHVKDSRPSLASEDFAVFGAVVPSFFYWVGSGMPGARNASWHSPEFCVGADYYKTAVPLLIASAFV